MLIARGLTNREIAARLYRSERTVDNHVQHIYEKLGINSRAELAVWVRDRGLLEMSTENEDRIGTSRDS